MRDLAKLIPTMYQALYRKYRPRTFDDVSGQEHITRTLKNQIEAGRTSHAYLFVGTRGTGKTTCAKILARAVNCERPECGNPCNECSSCRSIEADQATDVLEIDAASNNGVDNVRALRDEAVYSPATSKMRVYIIDEVHMLSGAAFNALLKILEEPPEHLLFILATTELHKVPATVFSRCQRFSFRRLSRGVIAERLLFVASRESFELSQDAAELISRLSDGSMRDAISLLDQCGGIPLVDLDHVREVIGLPAKGDASRLLSAIADRNAGVAFTILDELYMAGKQVAALFEELSELSRDALVAAVIPDAGNLLTGALSPEELRIFSKKLSPSRLTHVLAALSRAGAEFTRGTGDRLIAEIYLASMCDERLDTWPEAVVSRLERLESGAPAIQPGPAKITAAEIEEANPEAVFAFDPKPDEAEELPPWEIPAPEEEARLRTEKKRNAEPALKPETTADYEAVTGTNEDVWGQILAQLPASLTAVIGSCSALLEGGVLKISTGSAFAHSYLEKESTIQSIREAASKLTGSDIGVRTELRESSPDAQTKLDLLAKRFDGMVKYD